MLTDKDFQQLLEFSSQKPVVSLYLNIDPSEGNTDLHKLRLRKLLEQVKSPTDRERINQFFETEWNWNGRGIAVFSCVAKDFFTSYPLKVPVRTLVWEGSAPYITPLAALLDLYGHYGVALVDKEGAHLYAFYLGELTDREEVTGEAVQRVKHGSASSFPGRRSISTGASRSEDELEARNLRLIADRAAQFFERHRSRQIVIGGSTENVARFQSLLPRQWQGLVSGTFNLPMTARENEILMAVLELGARAEREREESLVDSLITAAAKGREGVVSLHDTLGAVHSGQVQTLVVDKDFHAPAYACANCGFLAARKVHRDVCPYCGKQLNQIPDAVDMAVRQVMKDGGVVEVVVDNPAMQEIGIGGLLRYA